MGFAALYPSYALVTQPARPLPRALLPAARQADFVEVLDQPVEQPAPVQLCLQPQEHAAEPDRRPVHQHELARRLDAAGALQSRMHAFGDLAAELRIVGLLDAAHAVLAQRLIQEARPQVQRRHLLVRQIGEAPGRVGVMRLRIVVVAHRLEQVDHAAHELRAEHADGAEIQQIDRARPAAPGNCRDADRHGSRRSDRTAHTRRGTAPRRCDCALPAADPPPDAASAAGRPARSWSAAGAVQWPSIGTGTCTVGSFASNWW